MQHARVIVDDLREQARSYTGRRNIPSQPCNNIATKYLANYLSTTRQPVYNVTP